LVKFLLVLAKKWKTEYWQTHHKQKGLDLCNAKRLVCRCLASVEQYHSFYFKPRL